VEWLKVKALNSSPSTTHQKKKKKQAGRSHAFLITLEIYDLMLANTSTIQSYIEGDREEIRRCHKPLNEPILERTYLCPYEMGH
jgi:hypothetical protein